jgi:Uma2 family endonuclease
MVRASTPTLDLRSEHGDQRVRLHGIRWENYEALLARRGESSSVRLTYLEGELELMSPSIDHETLKTRLARLLEAYAEIKDIELEGYGSWTVKQAKEQRGIEADECYGVGLKETPPKVPDIAIEVIWTSGGIDKLEVHRGLGVPEVWFWKDGALRFYTLRGTAYVPSPRSEWLPDLDPALIARFMGGLSQTQAVRAFRKALLMDIPEGKS